MIILHLVSKAEFDAALPDQPFVAANYPKDGFIHCTAEWDVMQQVANSYYHAQPGEFLVLEIDADRVTSPVRFEPPIPPHPPGHALAGHLFPHIYGPINRDAIVAIRTAARAADGLFVLSEV